MKIGILIREFDQLENWELRIIESIKNDLNLKLALLIEDGRKEGDYKSSKFSFNELLFNKQISIERNIYKNNIIQTVDRIEIYKYLNKIPSIKVNPKRNNDFDVFSHEDSQKVKEHNLDVILKHGFNTLKGEILNTAKQGIWLLVHGDCSKNSGTSGFWEVLYKKPVVPVKLLQLASEQNKGYIIDEAYYNPHRHWSFVQTNNITLESSVSLLFKHIKKTEKEKILLSNSVTEHKPFYKNQTLFNILKYSFNFYSILINILYKKFTELFGKKYDCCWTIFIGKGNFMEVDLSKLEPIKLPKGEFWADPFIFIHQNQQFVFFESLSYKTKKGKISCGLIEGNKIVNVKDVLELDYHLSYPFIFKEEGEIYMMPETMQNKRLEIYRCINFPDKWELFTTAFEGEIVADATFFTDKENIKWLFVTKKVSQNTDSLSELFIYKVDSLKLNYLEPHKQNPVIIDSRVARNGGVIFENEGKIYRPSQSSTDGIYGKALNVNQIEKLTIDEYKEYVVKKIAPNFQKGFISIHHLHQVEGMFVFDAAYTKK